MRLKILLIILVSILFTAPVSSTVLFYEDFEDALIVTSPGDWLLDTYGTGSQALSTEQVRAGSSAYKFSVTGSADDLVRQEMELRNHFNDDDTFNFIYGREYWIGFSIFLADGYYSPYEAGTWGVCHHQYHDVADGPPKCEDVENGRQNPIAIRVTQGKWNSWIHWEPEECYIQGTGVADGVYPTYDSAIIGQWTDFVINVKWSYFESGDGFTKIWKNGVLIEDKSGGNCYNDDYGPFMKIGIYGQINNNQVITIYYDELRVGDSDSSYNEVAPGGESLLPAVVAISTISDITPTTAIAHGSISDVGSANATKRGVCWNTTGNPTVASNKAEESGNFGIGAFSANMTGLNTGQHYYAKLYAYNIAGYGYSSQSGFYAQSTGTLISQSGWSLHYVDSEELVGESGNATNAFDGNDTTFWHSEWLESNPPCPHEIQINLGASYDIEGFRYLPRQDGDQNGRVAQYEFYTSTNGSDWGNATASDTFVNDILEKEVNFTSVTGQYVRLIALSEVNGNPWTSMAELNVLGVPVGSGHNNPSIIHGMQLNGCSIQ